jgi:hypothetical protein
VDCGAEFANLAQLTAHKADCPGALKNVQDDNPTDSDNAAFRAAPKKVPQAAPVPKPPPVAKEPAAKPPKPKAAPVMPVIPWGVPGVDPTLKVLTGTTPIRFEGQAYARQDGLHPFEVRTVRRRRESGKRHV